MATTTYLIYYSYTNAWRHAPWRVHSWNNGLQLTMAITRQRFGGRTYNSNWTEATKEFATPTNEPVQFKCSSPSRTGTCRWQRGSTRCSELMIDERRRRTHTRLLLREDNGQPLASFSLQRCFIAALCGRPSCNLATSVKERRAEARNPIRGSAPLKLKIIPS